MPLDQQDFELPLDRSVEGRALSAAELMATPDAMLAWLRSKAPTDIVALRMMSCAQCLGATFLRESGYRSALWGGGEGFPGGSGTEPVECCKPIGAVVWKFILSRRENVTAAEALEALQRACGGAGT